MLAYNRLAIGYQRELQRYPQDNMYWRLRREVFVQQYKLSVLHGDSGEFAAVHRVFISHLQGNNDDYNKKRIMENLSPLMFKLDRVVKVENGFLETQFIRYKDQRMKSKGKEDDEKPHWGFHGCKFHVIESICKNGLLPIGHKGNTTATATDDGWFGDPKYGIYVSKFITYCLKYTNSDIRPVKQGESVQVIAFQIHPGKCLQLQERKHGILPTQGYDSHTSPKQLEYFLFNTAQSLPRYILTVTAYEDSLTCTDDGGD